MQIDLILITTLVSYLIGSISFARIIARLVAPKEKFDDVVLDTGQGQPVHLSSMGATTVSIRLGGKVGCLIGIMDILKASAVTLAARLLFPGQDYFLFAGIGVVAGHIWPVFFKFRGGWGLSPILGVFLVMDWLGVIVSNIAGMILGLFILREVFLVFSGGLWLMAIWIWFSTHNWLYVGYVLLLNGLFILAVVPEIRVHLKNRKAGVSDMNRALMLMPMGRGVLKMMDKLGLSKKGLEQETVESVSREEV